MTVPCDAGTTGEMHTMAADKTQSAPAKPAEPTGEDAPKPPADGNPDSPFSGFSSILPDTSSYDVVTKTLPESGSGHGGSGAEETDEASVGPSATNDSDSGSEPGANPTGDDSEPENPFSGASVSSSLLPFYILNPLRSLQ
jgi:hypothetical protein